MMQHPNLERMIETFIALEPVTPDYTALVWQSYLDTPRDQYNRPKIPWARYLYRQGLLATLRARMLPRESEPGGGWRAPAHGSAGAGWPAAPGPPGHTGQSRLSEADISTGNGSAGFASRA